jgi:diaminopimelate decarboxylase
MRPLPFNAAQIEELARKYPTPFYVYDESGICASARTLVDAFSWCGGFKEYFAVKATPNPAILKILKDQGCGTDCSSLPELMLSERVGVVGEDIMFTSNDTPPEEFVKAKELRAIINLDDIGHIGYLEQSAGLPELLCFRYNPGAAKEGNRIIGDPIEAKFGLTRAQIFDAYRIAREKGVKRFGLHTMVVSNELRTEYFLDTARMLFELASEIKATLGIDLEFINLGGGLGIPYKPGDMPADVAAISAGIKALYEDSIRSASMPRVKLFMECGRYVTGAHGYLVSKVRHVKESYKTYIGLDACMANLMRPGMYGAYHHISVLGKGDAPGSRTYDVVGSLCENNDKFAIDRKLPEIVQGETLVIHDAGAHGHAMGFNYNGKLRSAEFLLKDDGGFEMIRRAETSGDYFATLDF